MEDTVYVWCEGGGMCGMREEGYVWWEGGRVCVV